jgi:hypothetical protein
VKSNGHSGLTDLSMNRRPRLFFMASVRPGGG